MKSFSGKLIFVFLVFSGCSIFFGTIGCNSSNQKITSLQDSIRMKDSVIKLWNSYYCESDSPDMHSGPKFICREDPGKLDPAAYIGQEYKNHHLALDYYPVLTPKMINALYSLNLMRKDTAPSYYAFILEYHNTLYTFPISKSEIESGKISPGDSSALIQMYDPLSSLASSDTTNKCVYPHCPVRYVYGIHFIPSDTEHTSEK